MHTCCMSLTTYTLELKCVGKCGLERAARCLSRPAYHLLSIKRLGLSDAEEV